MKVENAIKLLKNNISLIFSETKRKIKSNIYRGHSRSISTDIEDNITQLISNILPESYRFFLDTSIRLDGVTIRPDLLIVDKNNHVIAMIEMKANMGYCRDASGVINKIFDVHYSFLEASSLICKFSNDEKQVVTYDGKVNLFLVSLTDLNCSGKSHIKNKKYANTKGLFHFNLFTGWYDSLEDNEILDFLTELNKIKN